MEEIRFRALTREDWKGRAGGGLEADDNGDLSLAADVREGKLGFGLLDSGIADCIWHRLAIDAEIPENSSISLIFRAANEGTQFGPEGKVTLRAGMRDALIMGPKREEIVGRFVEVTVQMQRTGGKTPTLSSILVYYPRISYLQYLPAVYQEDEPSRNFLERFLSIFDTDLRESEDLISNISAFIDPAAAPARFLPWLAEWLNLDLYELMGDRNREYLANAVELYKWKGTARGLKVLAETLTARRCCIKEFGKNIFRSYGMENMLEGLNGSSASSTDCVSVARKVSLTVDTKNIDLSSIGSSRDMLHYTTDSRPDGHYSASTVGIYVLLVGNEGLPVDKDDLKHIIDSFLPVYVNSLILIENIEPTRVSHATDLIKDRTEVAVTNYIRESTGTPYISYTDRSSFSVIKSWAAKSGGVSNSIENRSYHRGITGTFSA